MPEIIMQGVKPEKAAQYWKTRRPLTDAERKELESGARSRAFAVAGVTQRQQLADIYGAIGKALNEGQTLADFKKEIAPIIKEQKWPAWRVETIFRTNLASAYAAGAWAATGSAVWPRQNWRHWNLTHPGCCALLVISRPQQVLAVCRWRRLTPGIFYQWGRMIFCPAAKAKNFTRWNF